MANSWIYDRHVKAADLSKMTQQVRWYLHASYAAFIFGAFCLFGSLFYSSTTTGAVMGGTQYLLVSVAMVGGLALTMGARYQFKAERTKRRRDGDREEIAEDIARLDEALGEIPVMQCSPDSLKDLLTTELQKRRARILAFERAVEDTTSLVEIMLPIIKHVFGKGILLHLSTLEDEIRSLEKLCAKFSLVENEGAGKLDWRS